MNSTFLFCTVNARFLLCIHSRFNLFLTLIREVILQVRKLFIFFPYDLFCLFFYFILSLHFTPVCSLQSAFYPSVCILTPVCSQQSAFYTDRVDRPTRLSVSRPFLLLHSCYEGHFILFCKEKIEPSDRNLPCISALFWLFSIARYVLRSPRICFWGTKYEVYCERVAYLHSILWRWDPAMITTVCKGSRWILFTGIIFALLRFSSEMASLYFEKAINIIHLLYLQTVVIINSGTEN